MTKPKLVSFTVCPYVQRAVLALEEKGVDYDVEFIDLRNKPQWFLDVSPRGKVPVLLDGGAALFESQAIVEYLDETRGGRRLTPEDARLRARDRAWFIFASEEIFPAGWKLESAQDAEAFDAALAAVRDKLGIVESALAGRDHLSGDGSRFGLADVAFGPFLFRVAAWERKGLLSGVYEGLPNCAAWAARVLARPSVPRSVPKSWDADIATLGAALGSHLASRAS